MADVRKIAIIFVIAVLFAILVFTSIAAVYPEPDRLDYCDDEARAEPLYPTKQQTANELCPDVTEPSKEENRQCQDLGGYIQWKYDKKNCPETYQCSCHSDYNAAMDKHSFVSFLVSSILALIAIALGLFLPHQTNSLHEWIGTGFMIGGLFALFFSTGRYFGDLHRFLRPVVILAELIIVIYISYRKLGKKKLE